MFGVHPPVRQDEDIVAPLPHRVFGLRAQPIDGPGHAVGAIGGGKADVEGSGSKRAVAVIFNLPDALQFVVGQNRLGHRQAHIVVAVIDGPEQIGTRPDQRQQRHHQLFADRVNGRVGDLSEILLEITRQMLAAVGQHRGRHVGAHGADRLGAIGHHRQE